MRKLPAKFMDLAANFSNYENMVIEFGEKIKECETDFTPKMRGKIVNIYPIRSVVALVIDDSKYFNHNDQFAARDYFDENHVPCLTAKEAGFHQCPTTIYFTENDFPADYFSIVPTDNVQPDTGPRTTLTTLRASMAKLKALLTL